IHDYHIGISTRLEDSLSLQFKSARGVQRDARQTSPNRPPGPWTKVRSPDSRRNGPPAHPPSPTPPNPTMTLAGLSPQRITAARHIRRTDRVCGQQHKRFAFGSGENPYNRLIDVYSVRDDLRKDSIVGEHFGDDAWVAMRERPHRIESVNGIASSS